MGTAAQMARANSIASRANGSAKEPMTQATITSSATDRTMRSSGNRRLFAYSRRYQGMGQISNVKEAMYGTGPRQAGA